MVRSGRDTVKRVAAVVVVTLVFALIGGVVGYFLGNAAFGAMVSGALGLYASTMNADYIARTDPRTRGATGGGGGGPFVG